MTYKRFQALHLHLFYCVVTFILGFLMDSEESSSISCFEELSNEIFYEIFEYLDICDAYEAFYDLNNCFHNIFIQLTLPYKIYVNLISKRDFEKHCKYIRSADVDRIISLHLLNWICVNNYFSLVCIDSSFIRLESLVLNGMKSEKLIPLLKNFSLLPRLFSLSLTTIGSIQDPNAIHRLLFALPVLKYCKTMFSWQKEKLSLSSSTGEYSKIEYFITNCSYNFKKLSMLVSYMPYLTHLSCDLYSSSLSNFDVLRPITLNNLKYFNVKHSILFNEFEVLISNMYHQIEVLRISSKSNRDCLDSNRWERLISNHFPRLRKFDFEHIVEITNGDTYYSLIDGFNSLFWIERQWFFTPQYYQYKDTYWLLFYSINQTCLSENFVSDHVHYNLLDMNKTKIDLYCSKLILSSKNNHTKKLVYDKINGTMSSEQLNILTVVNNNFQMEEVQKLLRSSSSLETITLSIYSSNILSSLNENNNSVQHIIIRKHLTLEDIKQLISKYPYLKSIEINIYENDLELIIRFIFKRIMNKNCSLYMLALRDTHSVIIKRLEKIIEREELIHNYSIEYISDTAYLWW
ncbi:unnamed protein product [Rotaria sp. Silwood2]|nr:unnamed protein product [Rotaria sp. Silwood2]CAF4373422.1 unnamed protein product [Rotaria sp. Silwood2]